MSDNDQDLRSALEKCRNQFEFYVQQHLAKAPPDMEKAATNQEFVELCTAVLAQPAENAKGGDVAAMREAAAKVADGNVMSGNGRYQDGYDTAARKIARAIRELPLP
ncbi:hypothetical protein [Sphingobium sp. YR768]|uniref:hypothetical protein n=1 Tax=Sphingobium sp. YR768 TaxID=1884365 RepID=UPI0008CA1B92|nr:hypothetical protein [Sphingobium sp. YR768]SES09040.1 hypothetical protein SAMN05518866_13767 [Sphingobium sp. YR768]